MRDPLILMLAQCGGSINCPAEIVGTDLCGDRMVHMILHADSVPAFLRISAPVRACEVLATREMLGMRRYRLHAQSLTSTRGVAQYRGCANATFTCQRVNSYYWQCQSQSLNAGHPVPSQELPPLPPLPPQRKALLLSH